MRSGALRRGRRRFEDNFEPSLVAGIGDSVLDVYRLSARVFAAGSGERAVYDRLAQTLAERIAAAPGMSQRSWRRACALRPVEVPRFADFEARQLGGRS